MARLTALIGRQRRELDRMRAQAAARSVVDTAQGVLMERLGCTPAEASRQLAHLAHESATPLAELAAEITGQHLAAEYGQPADGDPGWRRLAMASAALDRAPDGDRIAEAALEQVLAPLGGSALALWLIILDGSLELAGQAGLGMREAERWRYIPPVMDCPAQRVAKSGAGLFWSAGRPRADPVPAPGARPDCGRAVLPMGGRWAAAGVLEACWPEALPGFGSPVRRQLVALADLCGRALAAAAAESAASAPHSPGGDAAGDSGAAIPAGDAIAGTGVSGAGPAAHAAAPGAKAADHPVAAPGAPPLGPRAWGLHGLLDGVLDSALFVHPIRGNDETVTDFEISHVSSGFHDPAGRDPADLVGRPLLEMFPGAALTGGLFDRTAQVLSTGEPQHLPRGILGAQAGEARLAPVMDIRVARLYDGLVIAWRRADEAERLASLLEHAERLGRIGGWEENLLTGEIRWTESASALFGQDPAAIPLKDLHTHVLADDIFAVEQFRRTLLQEKRATAAAFRIIRADDESVRHLRVFAEPVTDPAGTLAAVRGAFQDVSAYYHTQLALTATRDRLADTEERADDEHRLAVRLQQAITPRTAEPVAAAGLDIAARYRPASSGHLVSGDWYDTVLLPSQKILLAVGDIAGHGIDAVTGMVALRNCLRGLAITGAGPASLLSWLNQVACHLTDGIIGTAVCGLYDPATRVLRWARAGHLPPVLVRDRSAAEVSSDPDLLLGADPAASYHEITTSLRPGDGLLLFTDGLVERRDQPIDEALAFLLRAASRPIGRIADYADHLLNHATSDTGDDACLVAVQVR
jgi:hypothetical protein